MTVRFPHRTGKRPFALEQIGNGRQMIYKQPQGYDGYNLAVVKVFVHHEQVVPVIQIEFVRGIVGQGAPAHVKDL